MIFNGNAYGINAEKAFYGTVNAESETDINLSFQGAAFSYEDSTNDEYVASGRALTYTIEASFFAYDDLEIAGSFDTNSTGPFGELNMVNDSTYTTPSSLNSLTGLWSTTNYQLKIDHLGNFIIRILQKVVVILKAL